MWDSRVGTNVFAWIDGRLEEVCRPTYGQRAAYDGHHREHGLVYQGVKAPDGLFIDLFGPWGGRRSDAFLVVQSGILDSL